MVSISADLVKAALDSQGEPCKTGCIHAEGIVQNLAQVYEIIVAAVAAGMEDKALAIYSAGLHAGYRIHQLEVSKQPTIPFPEGAN